MNYQNPIDYIPNPQVVETWDAASILWMFIPCCCVTVLYS